MMDWKGFFRSCAIIEKNLSFEALSSSIYCRLSSSNKFDSLSSPACLIKISFFSYNSAVLAVTRFSSRIFCFFKCRTREIKTKTSTKTNVDIINNLNHNVSHHGGKIIMLNETPFSFHIPSLFDAFTLKVYLPGSRLV